jgi:hypothetical protein
MTARRLEIRPDGGDDLDAGTLSPAAWERWNAEAVWCSLQDLSTHRRELRLAIVPPHAVVSDGEERLLLAATSAPAVFWAASGLYTTVPSGNHEVDAVALAAAVTAWLDGEEPEAAPRAVHARLGRGDELMREEILLDLDGGWLSGRRYAIEDEPMVTLDDFSMKDLLLDLSALLALSAIPD